MTKIRHSFLMAAFLLALGGFQAASAAIVTLTLGNFAPGFADGSTPPLLGTDSIGAAQTGQSAPFNGGKGSDVASNPGNLSESWTFTYAAIADTILSATLTLGIVDHDSAASGDQVALYDIDGNDLTSALNTGFEAAGGSDGEYNIYSLNLASSIFADLADGSALVNLALQGKGLQTCTLVFICPGAPVVSETDYNGAFLIFSKLEIETRDSTIPAVPIPAAAPLFASALFLVGLYRRRVARNAA